MSGYGFHWSPCGGGGGDRFALGALVALGLLIVGVVGAARAVWHAIGPAVTEAAEVTALVLISATGAAGLGVLALLVLAARRRVLARYPAPSAGAPLAAEVTAIYPHPRTRVPARPKSLMQGKSLGHVPPVALVPEPVRAEGGDRS